MTKFIHDANTRKAIELAKSGKSFFITGKAGTGKTMLLREIHAELKKSKKVVVCAPTGVAAKNAQGTTLHSQFHIPISIYLPNHKVRQLYNLDSEQEIIVRQIDTLIIDEVSMVRCDTLDMLNKILQYYRQDERPFGGLQVILFGDMRQLMPVVKDDDWEKLKQYYKAPYFFCSEVLSTTTFPMLELTKVHRQSDSKFISLLNSLRDGKLSSIDELAVNSRYKPEFIPSDDLKYIYLTTHRHRAKNINSEKLELLKNPIFEFKAFVKDGIIPKNEAPADWHLQLKKGARVMFITNDNTHHRYCNGTLGVVTYISEQQIIVRTDEGVNIDVNRASWDFYKYVVNKRTKEIERVLLGTFCQYPLRLAWAITIHKSQGLTFDRVIIDAGRAFTYGQVYVALSRCRTLEGIILKSKITQAIVKIDPVVTEYMQLTERIWSNTLELTEDNPSCGVDSQVTERLSQYDYTPIGTIFQIEGDDMLYDAWEDASQVYCIDRLVVKDGQLHRLCVAQYSEGTLPFEIIDVHAFHLINTIRFVQGRDSYTSILQSGVETIFSYSGRKCIDTKKHKVTPRKDIWNKIPTLRSYTYERTGDKLKIIKHSITTSTPSVINEYSDLGKLLLSGQKHKILRNKYLV